MDEYAMWFEGLCTALASNPSSATPALIQFRNSDQAHQICCHILTTTASSNVKFQALLVLKFTTVKKWKTCSADVTHEFQMFLWNLLLSRKDMESFVLNKLIQVYVVSIKKSWMTDTDQKRTSYFTLIEALIAQSASPEGLQVASRVLRAVVEELTAAEDLDAGLTQVECSRLRRDFILGDGSPDLVSGLKLAATLSLSMLRRTYEITTPFESFVSERGGEEVVSLTSEQLSDVASAIQQISHVITVILKCCESSVSSAMDGLGAGTDDSAAAVGSKGFSAMWLSSSGGPVGSSAVSIESVHAFSWLPSFVGTDMVLACFKLHQRIRSVLLELARNLCGCLGAVRQMLIAFAGIDLVAILPNHENKFAFAELMLSGAVVMLRSNMTPDETRTRFGRMDFPLLFTMRDDGEYALQEFTQSADLLIRVLGNFKLSIVSALPSFEHSVKTLAELTQATSCTVSRLCGNLSTIDDPSVLAAYSEFLGASPALLDGPLGDLLSQLVDAWCMLLMDSMLVDVSSAMAEEDIGRVTRLKLSLRDLCAESFHYLFSCVVEAVIWETLAGQDEEIDVDNDEIAERSLLDTMRGISIVGRMSISASVRTATSHLDKSLEQMGELHSRLLRRDLSGVSQSQLRNEVVRQLEIQRLCCDFISCLIIESSDGLSNGAAVALKSSEIPLIPLAVLDTCRGSVGRTDVSSGETENLVVFPLTCLLRNLEQQGRFHQHFKASVGSPDSDLLESYVSPIVVRGLLMFMRDCIRAYIDPDPGMYESPPQSMCPGLMLALSTGHFESSFLEPLLRIAFYFVVQLGGSNNDLCCAALELLKCVSKLPLRLYRIGAWPVVFQYVEYARSTICKASAAGQADHSLSPANQALLWEYLGNMAHELAADVSHHGAQELGQRFVMELCVILKTGLGQCWTALQGGGSAFAPLASDALFSLASFRGFARCSCSLSPTSLQLLDDMMPPMYAVVETLTAQATDTGNIVSGSLVLNEWLGFLSDFAEATPLSSLSVTSLHIVMEVAQKTLLHVVYNHLRFLGQAYSAATSTRELARPKRELASLVHDRATKKGSMAATVEDRQEMSSLFIDILVGALTYIDHIASSDVSTPLRSATAPPTAFGGSRRAVRESSLQIDTLLCQAVLMMSSQIMTVDIVNTHKVVQEKFISIANLVLRSHPTVFCSEWLGMNPGIASSNLDSQVAVLSNLLAQILCSIDASDSGAGRHALLALKSFGAYYKKIMNDYGNSANALLINTAAQVFLSQSLSFLIGMMMPTASGAITKADMADDTREEQVKQLPGSRLPLLLLKDRIDTFASTLLELSQIDNGNTMFSISTSMFNSQPNAMQLRITFEKLFSDRGVSVNVQSKANERNFILNMRDCIVDLQLNVQDS